MLARLSVVMAGPPSPPACTGEPARVLTCIRSFSWEQWLDCTIDASLNCHCDDANFTDYCCGSSDQADAIAIWEARGDCPGGSASSVAENEETSEESEEGWPSGFAPCYFLWAVAVLYSCSSSHSAAEKAKSARTQAELNNAKHQWEGKKQVTIMIFFVCTVLHYASAVWLGGQWIFLGLGPCIFFGIIVPTIACSHGDKAIQSARPANRPQIANRQRPPTEIAGSAGGAGGMVELNPAVEVPVVAGTLVIGQAVQSVSAVSAAAEAVPSAAVDPSVARATLKEMSDLLAWELGLEAPTCVQTIDLACQQLGVRTEGKSLIEKAKEACAVLGRPQDSIGRA